MSTPRLLVASVEIRDAQEEVFQTAFHVSDLYFVGIVVDGQIEFQSLFCSLLSAYQIASIRLVDEGSALELSSSELLLCSLRSGPERGAHPRAGRKSSP